jgi:hypothetical protein
MLKFAVQHISLECAVSDVQSPSGDPKMNRLSQHLRNGLLSFGLFLLSIGIGLAVNSVRPEHLPLVYQAPAAGFQRLESGQLWNPGITVIDVSTAKMLVEQRAALVLDARPDLFFEVRASSWSVEPLKKELRWTDYGKCLPKITEAEAAGVPLLLYCAHEHCEDAAKGRRGTGKEGPPDHSDL